MAGRLTRLDLLDPDVAKEAKRILDRHLGAAIGIVYGEAHTDPEGWKLAIELGMVDPKKPQAQVAADLFAFGVYLTHVDQAGEHSTRYGMTAPEFLAALAKDAVPTVRAEYDAADYCRNKAALRCRGLGNTIDRATGETLIEADARLRAEMEATIQDALAARFGDDDAAKRMAERGADQGKPEGFYDGAFRAELRRIESDLGHATKDWSRDWRRIVQTEAEDAIQRGKMAGWRDQEAAVASEEKRPPRPVYVYKLPRPGACSHCLRLHLEAGYPRIFTLEQLSASGTNVGRRAADWQPVVGAVHPYCACELMRLPTFVQLPTGWRPGQSAPTVVGSDGRLVRPGSS